jgi:excisionase family DNA binding protein
MALPPHSGRIPLMAFDIITALEEKTGLLTVNDVASVFSISTATVNRMVRTRKIPSFLIGGKRTFDPAQLTRWIIKKNPRIMDGRTSSTSSKTEC